MEKIEELSSNNQGRKQWLKDGVEARADEILEESGEDLQNKENIEIARELATEELTSPETNEGNKILGEIEKMEEEEYNAILDRISKLERGLQESKDKFPYMKQIWQKISTKVFDLPKRELRKKFDDKRNCSVGIYAFHYRNTYNEGLIGIKSLLDSIEQEYRQVRGNLDSLKGDIDQLLANNGSIVEIYRREGSNSYWSDIRDKFVSSGRSQFEGASLRTVDPNDFSIVTSVSHFNGENFNNF
jgi:hypothetical protein